MGVFLIQTREKYTFLKKDRIIFKKHYLRNLKVKKQDLVCLNALRFHCLPCLSILE